MDPPMPAAVKTQRRQLGWSTKEQEWVSYDKTWHLRMKCHEMSWHVMKCHEMSWHVMKCHEMSWNVMKCHEMSWNVMKWHEMSWNVMKCHEMSWNVMKCHEMSWNAMKCHELSLVYIAPSSTANGSAGPSTYPAGDQLLWCHLQHPGSGSGVWRCDHLSGCCRSLDAMGTERPGLTTEEVSL